MSTTIDQKVVEMRFDNSHFEKNVSGTMSTLDKLKQKLNLSGASKGLENINTAANKVNMNGLSKGVETVTAKFSALQVVGTTALVNITNSAVNAGKRMISALTIDPVKTGFSEYETQINAVQTILANTSHNGTTIDQVNEALDLLNTYADKTIYNFTEMTRNIGTFTAAGVDLQTSVDSIQGIANLAAVSGSTSQQASTAMYQLSQALAAGKVSLMDWNSVVNAGMGGKVFQDALVRTSELLGTGAKGAIDMYGSFRESLTKGEWLTTEVLTETLKQFAGAYSEADLIAQGFTEQQAKDIAAMAKTAEEAATKVKTFTQLWDVLKESAQSGWSQTWKIIIGDYEEAKELLSPLADILTGFINKMSDARNRIVEGVLDFASPWTSIMDKLGKVKEVAKSVEKVTDKLEYFQNVVNNVWRGDYKNSDTGRFELLEKAGYDHRVVQDLVNKGYQYKLTVEDIEASHKKFGLTMETTTEKTKEVTSAFNNLSEEKLKEAGLTEDEIKLYQDLQREAERTGKSVSELAEEMSKTSGRTLLIESFKNIGNGLLNVFRALGEAWKEIFDPVSIVGIYNALKAFNNFTLSIKNYLGVYDEASGEFVKLSENGENLKRTFKGIFAVLDIITTLIGGGFKIAFKLVTSVLKYFNLDILDVTAAIGDALVKFRDWFDSLFDVSGALDVIVPLLVKAGGAIKTWITQFKNSEQVQKFVERISSAFKDLKTSIDQIGGIKGILSGLFKWLTKPFQNIDLRGLGKDILDGLYIGLVGGAGKVISAIIDVATNIIKYFKDIIDSHSPSKVFIAIGGFIISGLLLGLKAGFISVPESLQTIVDKCLSVLKNIDWGAVFAVGVSLAGLYFLKKIGDALGTLAAPLEGLGEVFEATAGVLKSLSFEIKTKAIKNLAISLAILVGCVLAIVALCGDDYPKVLKAVGIIAALAVVLGVLAIASSKMSDSSIAMSKNGIDISGLKQNLLSIAAAIGILAVVVKLVGSMPMEQALQGFGGLITIMGLILGFLAVTRLIVSNKSAKNIDKIGTLMFKISLAMLLMAAVVKVISKLKLGELAKGGLFVAGFAAFLTALAGISRLAGKNIDKLGGTMVKLSIAMGLMVFVLKLVNLLSLKDVLKGALFAGGFILFVKALVKVTTVGKDTEMAKVGGLLLSISISLGLMVGVCKLAGRLSVEDIIKGAAFMTAFTIFVGILVKVTTIASDKQIAKVGLTILAISIALGILATVSMVLSLISLEGLAKGITAVSILSAMMALMIHSLKDANDVKGSLIVMAVAIGIMAAAVAGLSLIDTGKLAGATGTMSALMGMFSLMIHTSKNVGKSIGPLIVMTAAIGVMAGALWLLSKLDVQSSLQNATALSVLMVAMSGCLLIISKTNTTIKSAMQGVLALAAMVIPMIAFIGALGLMSLIGDAEKNAKLLIGLMTTMTLLLIPLCIIGAIAGTGVGSAFIIAGIAALTAMAIPMLVFIGLLALMNNIQNADANAKLLINLLTTMTDLLIKISIVAPLAVMGVGAMAGLTLVMASIGGLAVAVGALFDKFPTLQKFLDTGLPVLEQLAGGIGRMVGNFVGGIGEGLSASLIPIGENITEFIKRLKIASEEAEGINGSSFDGVKQLIEALVGVGLASVGMTIADVFTNALGDQSAMEKFESDGKAFFKAIKAISEEMVGFEFPADFSMDGLLTLIEAIQNVGTAMIGVSFADIFTNAIGDQSAMEKFKTDGIAFFKAIQEIAPEMTGISLPKDFSVDALTTLLDAIKSVSSTMVGVSFADVFTTAFGGDQTAMQKFKTDGIAFFNAIRGIKPYMTGLSLPEDFSMDALTSLIDAIKSVGSAMVGASFKDMFTIAFGGDQTAMQKFKTDGIAFFNALRGIKPFMTGLSLPEDFSLTQINTLLEAFKSIGEYSVGSTWDDIFTFGGTSMEKFQSDGTAFFQALKGITKEATGITTSGIESAQTAVTKLKKIIESTKGIDDSGVAKFTGIGTGGAGADGPIHDIAVAIEDFGDTLSGVNTEAISSSVSTATKIKNLINSLVGIDTTGISNFKADEIATIIKNYSDSVSGINSSAITTSITSIRALIDLIKKMNGMTSGGVTTFKNAISQLSTVSLDGLAQKFNGSANQIANVGSNLINFLTNGMKSKQSTLTTTATVMITALCNAIKSKNSQFKNIGMGIITEFISGMTSKKATLHSSATSLVSSAVSKLRDKYQSFYNAGSHLVSGFASGISENSYKASAKAAAMATAAYEAAKDALDINSPSKVFRKIGYSVPEGFAMGIDRLSGLVQNSATGMADGAIKNVSRSISRIGDAVNADIDSQPTIRPVLDLSDVRSGASTISGLFNEKTLVGVQANVSSINRSMNDNLQNGGNSDIISAINKLRKDLGNVGNTTYQINGITYDDGSALQDAFGTIVRQARIERRV